ncbi:MAG: DUF1570 domain-containing protein [Blastocatellia bacterium]|nr:DUF1570 domain-containing protein [Chloracidobacterium sp.]MBL8185608.1 DUF1570 domain-containing protein [Blastocatellia bacterium]HRJ90508.1 DUF1570 domain-containing protein [Pyrinomonadaceae bacterium]HRK50777.1 DUF1570 domain-containing protein [Pyrinomonadaceae bacterium]
MTDKSVPQPLLIVIFVFVAAFAIPAVAQDKWTSARSTNFHLIGDAKEAEIRRVATRLEQFREVFVQLFPSLRYSSPVPTTVIVFRNEKAFRPYKPQSADGKAAKWVAGYFSPREDANYIVLSTEGESRQTYQTIYHEYVHYLVNNSFGRSRVPPWFNEGLAEYYDQFSIEGDIRVNLGDLNNNHLYTLQNTKLIPLQQFFSIDYFTLHQQGSHSANIFYAQSWALMHYLIHGKGGNRANEINAYLNAIGKGETPEAAFRAAFKTSFEEMEKELRRYVGQSTYKGFQITFKNKLVFDDEIKTEPMSLAAANAYLGDLLLGSGRIEEAEARLAESLAAETDNILANSTMGMAKMRQRKFADAKGFLEKARRAETAGHLVHYRYAYVLSREAMDGNGWVANYSDEAARTIRESLRKAIAANPNFPESYSLLAFIALVRNDEIDEAIGQIRTALRLSPGNENYMLHLAGLHGRKRDFDEAKRLAEGVYKTAQDPNVRTRARSVLQNVSDLQRYSEREKKIAGGQAEPDIGESGLRRQSVVVVGADEELTEEKLKELAAAAELESLNRILRKPQAGEKRILGHLNGIECSRDSITFLIEEGSATVRLTSKDFQGLELTSYVDVPDLQIGCGSIKQPIWAVITYVPEQDQKKKTAGRIIAIDIVPERLKSIE